MSTFVHVNQSFDHPGVHRAEVALSHWQSFMARMAKAWRAHAERRALARADEQLMAYAQFDPRLLQELRAVVSRDEA